jgi:hypothetical protein
MLVVGIDWHTYAFDVWWWLVLILREECFGCLVFVRSAYQNVRVVDFCGVWRVPLRIVDSAWWL